MKYTITYYSESVQESVASLPKSLQAHYINLTDRMVIYGAYLGEPHTKALGNGLFELRLKGSDGIARVFYWTLVNRRIVMLHSFVKKTQKFPQRELRIAENRLKEIKNANA